MQNHITFGILLAGWITSCIGTTVMNPAPYQFMRLRTSLGPGVVAYPQPIYLNHYRSVLVPAWVPRDTIGGGSGIMGTSAMSGDASHVQHLGRSTLYFPPGEPSRQNPRCLLDWFTGKQVENTLGNLMGGTTDTGFTDSNVPAPVPPAQASVLPGPVFPSQATPGLNQANQAFQNAQAMEAQVNSANAQWNSALGNVNYGAPNFPVSSVAFRDDGLSLSTTEPDVEVETMPVVASTLPPGDLADFTATGGNGNATTILQSIL